MPWPEAAVLAVTLAAVATLSSPIAVDAVVDRVRVRSRVPPVLQLTARIDALIAVVAFGLVLAIFHQGDVAPGVRPPTATEWSVINLAVGVASGVLFHLFLGPRGHLDEGRLFVALAGAIVVASGASYYLNLSPIFTNLVLGFILVNSGSAHRDVTRLLLATERPVYLALLLFAGAAWSPGSVDLLFIAPLFVIIRVAARFLGGWMAGGYVAPTGAACARPGAGPARTGRDRRGPRTQLWPGLSRFPPAPGADRHAAGRAAVRDRRQPRGVRLHPRCSDRRAGPDGGRPRRRRREVEAP